ncbi:cadherin-like domain-containing protein [Gammaproteobacteria bacterium]|nr:cadherin-like domain-containing protein [Gammaproteobacteria bacterium]
MHSRVNFLLIISLLLIVSCGGGGGGGGSSEVPASSGGGSSPAPISGSTQAIALTFSTSSSDVELNGSVTLTWAGTNATSCDASGAWGGNNKAASGSETVNMTLTGTQTFSIVCKNAADTVTASTSVEVYQVIGGTVLDGYIRGAEVFVDRNNNLTLDSNESSVTTDNNGAFSNLRGYQGQLIAKDGIDLDTAFIFENFSLTAKTASDKTAYIISPLTSVGSLLDTPSDINKIFGISDSIDVYSEDPVAKIDDPAFANLYSIGNKLTALAMSVQTLEGNNKNLQDIFQTIATQAQNIYVETESSIQVDNNVLISNTLFNQLPTSMDADLRSDLGIVIGNSLYLLQVKDNKAATTGIQNFAFTTLQADLLKIQQLDAGVSIKYKEDIFNYVATDQNLSLSDVTVAITANDDSLNVNEDSQVMFTWSSIYSNDVFLRFADASASYVSLPQNGSITNTDLEYFYTPNLNFNGTDSFSYKLEQGGQESVATVTVIVNPVNDLPVLSGINNSYQKTLAYGAQAVGSLGVSDVDGDAFTYSLSGADASLFAIGSSGEISFNSAATDARIYKITVQVSDGTASVTQDLEITVNPNQSPVISCGNCSFNLEYNSKNVGSVSSSDEEGDTITYSLSGTDASLFSISESGAVAFNANATDARTYDVTVIASDGISTAAEKNLSITVNPRDPDTTYTGTTSGFETFTGGSGDDTFNPGPGSATIDGGSYNDTVIFFANRSNATLTTLSGITKISFNSSNGCNDHCFDDYTLTNVETVTFADQSVTLSTTLPASLIRGSSNSAEIFDGNSNDNVFDPGPGNATIDGGGGSDTVIFFANRSNATLTTLSGITKISFNSSNGCNDHCFDDYTLTNVETVTFADSSVNLNAGWKQLGTDIDGKISQENSGKSVAMTPDGNTIAIGSPRPGTNGGIIRVYQWNGSDWTLKGDELTLSGDNLDAGYSLAISDDGNRIIWGGPSFNGAAINSGMAQVFEYSGGSWSQLGATFNGTYQASRMGKSVDISADGNFIIVGADEGKTDPSGSDGGGQQGLFKVYNWVNNDWLQVGSTIYGQAVADYDGDSVQINQDGTRIAAGAWRHDNTGTDSGWFRVYELVNDEWSILGNAISFGGGTFWGVAVAMSSDGSTVAALAPGYNENGDRSGQVRVFDYANGQWMQHGNVINGEAAGDHLIETGTLALNSDGSRLIIGADLNDAGSIDTEDIGHARVYRYNSECTSSTCAEVDTWIQVGEDIDGESFKDRSGSSVGISADGKKVIIGALCNDGDANNNVDCRGHARVYEYNE